MRLFIAVNIPGDVRSRVSEIQQRLKGSLADVKWVPEDNLHLTLKFLGEVAEDRFTELFEAITNSTRGFKPFGVSISGTGAFPSAQRPRVVWAGVTDGADNLTKLAGEIDSGLELIGFEKEKRPFSPHLTLGRVRSARNLEALSKRLASTGNLSAGGFTAGSVDVMSSITGPSGADYTCLRSVSI